MADKKVDIAINLTKYGKGAVDAANEIKAIDKSSDATEKSLKNTEKAAKKTGTAFKNLSASVKKMGTGFVSTFKSLKFEALAFAGILAGAVHEAVKNNINVARAWTMTSTLGFKEMRTGVRDLSMEMGLAKDQISGGLYQALSAGVPEDNVFSFLKTASKVAIADSSDVSVAVDGITTVLNAFKIEATETDKVADLLFQTVSNGKTTFADLAQNLATVAPLAASTGVGIDQILAATATLTKQGTPTAQAMTQIRASIIALNDNLGDGWSKAMTYQEAVKKLANEAGGSQSKIKDMVGSVEALGAVLGLTGANAKMAQQDLADLGNSTGALDAATSKMDGFRHWNRLWESIQGFVTRVGEILDGAMKDSVESIAKSIAEWAADDKLFDSIAEKTESFRKTIEGLWEAVKAGKGAEVAENIGQTIYGYMWKAGEKVAEVLLAAASGIGKRIADSINPVTQLKNKWNAGKELESEGELNWAQVLVGMLGDVAPLSDSPSDKMNARASNQTLTQASAADEYLAEVRQSTENLISEYTEGAEKISATTEAVTNSQNESSEKMVSAADKLENANTNWVAAIHYADSSMDQFFEASENGKELLVKGTEALKEGVEATEETAEAMNDAGEAVTENAEQNTELINTTTDQVTTDITAASQTVNQSMIDATTLLASATQEFGQKSSSGIGEMTNLLERSLDSMDLRLSSILARVEYAEAQARSAAVSAEIATERLRNLVG